MKIRMRMRLSCGKLCNALILLILFTLFFDGCNIINYKNKSPSPLLQSPATVKPEDKCKNNVFIGDINFFGMSRSQISYILDEYSKIINVPKKEPDYEEKNWNEIIIGENGKNLNIDKTIDLIFEASEGTRINPIIDTINFEHTPEELKAKISLISEYKTKIYDTIDTRVKNLVIASSVIDGLVLNPGDAFSFNGIIGDTTKLKGYEDAPIYIKDKNGKVLIVDSPGGGICQVSSTLFNLADNCKLEIIERHIHSKPVGYVPKGRDAAISYGTLDLKFQNNRDKKVMIKIMVRDGYIVSSIFEKSNL